MKFFENNTFENTALLITATVLLVDILLIFAYVLWSGSFFFDLAPPIPVRLNIGEEKSWASLLLLAKWAAIFGLLSKKWLDTRHLVFLCLAIVVLVLLFDDGLEIHEKLGGRVAKAIHLGPKLALRAQDYGEIIVISILGVFCAGTLMVGYLYSSSTTIVHLIHFGAILVILAFFGVALDMFHSMGTYLADGHYTKAIAFAVGLTEDGGEMLVGTLMLAFGLDLQSRD